MRLVVHSCTVQLVLVDGRLFSSPERPGVLERVLMNATKSHRCRIYWAMNDSPWLLRLKGSKFLLVLST
jgi:hypothetical protein